MKSSGGRYFEDFRVGQVFRHASPRTVTDGDVAFYRALTGSRFALQSSDDFAHAVGHPMAPADDFLVFNIVFAQSVPDVGINAVANLGYAGCRFIAPVYPGETISAVTEVIGLRDTGGRTGVVYLRTTGHKDGGVEVMDFARWQTVRKAEEGVPPFSEQLVPPLPAAVPADALGARLPVLDLSAWDTGLSGSRFRWGDYELGERIDHVDGVLIDEGTAMMAARFFGNPARQHPLPFSDERSRGRWLVPGGIVMAIARALTFNGLANAIHVAAINGGRYVGPVFTGSTVHAWSTIVGKELIDGRDDLGALRVRLVGTRDQAATDFPDRDDAGAYLPSVVLDLDLWLLMPR
jgi:2-methylfumaryl-CoA hydratase